MLLDRHFEREELDRALATAREGSSAVLVLRGEPGVGKTALLDYAVDAAGGLAVVRLVGIESERELGFASLHQLLRPFLERLDALPGPQYRALATAFGLREGSPPDRFLVGLAALTPFCPTRPQGVRSSASLTTRSGSTKSRPEPSPSSPVASTPMPSLCFSRCGTYARSYGIGGTASVTCVRAPPHRGPATARLDRLESPRRPHQPAHRL